MVKINDFNMKLIILVLAFVVVANIILCVPNNFCKFISWLSACEENCPK